MAKKKCTYGIDFDKKIPLSGGEEIGVVEFSSVTLIIHKGWYDLGGESFSVSYEFVDGCHGGGMSVETKEPNAVKDVLSYIQMVKENDARIAQLIAKKMRLNNEMTPIQKHLSSLTDEMFQLVRKDKDEGD